MEIIFEIFKEDGTPAFTSNAGVDQIPGYEHGLTKLELERSLLDCYQHVTNYRGHFQFEFVAQGDSPDFTVSRDGREFGLDVAVFGDEKRRSAEIYFSEVKSKLIEIHDSGLLRKCKGLAFQLSFPKDWYSKNQVSKIENIGNSIKELANQIGEIAAYDEIDPKAKRKERRLKQRLLKKKSVPHCGHPSGLTSDGNIAWMVTSIMHNERNDFERKCGFSVSFIYSEALTNEEILERINKIIKNHDKSESQNIEELVIFAGAIGKYGHIILHEEVLADLFLRSGLKVTKPVYIKRVVLVLVGAFTAHLLYPNLLRIT
jgi:hypothetical protein